MKKTLVLLCLCLALVLSACARSSGGQLPPDGVPGPPVLLEFDGIPQFHAFCLNMAAEYAEHGDDYYTDYFYDREHCEAFLGEMAASPFPLLDVAEQPHFVVYTGSGWEDFNGFTVDYSTEDGALYRFSVPAQDVGAKGFNQVAYWFKQVENQNGVQIYYAGSDHYPADNGEAEREVLRYRLRWGGRTASLGVSNAEREEVELLLNSLNFNILNELEQPLGQEGALALFAAAEEAMAWFSGRAQPQLGSGQAQLFGQTYQQVADARFADMVQLADYLNTLFTADFTAELLATEVTDNAAVFAESEGKLYMFGGYAAQLPYDIGQREFAVQAYPAPQDGLAYVALTLTYTAHLYDQGPLATQLDYQLTQGEDGSWRFDHFVLPVDLLLNRAEFSCRVEEGWLMLGRQQGDFPWGLELSQLSRADWKSDGFYIWQVNCEQPLRLSGVLTDDKAMAVTGILITSPDYPTWRNAGVGMSETQLLECYPVDLYLLTDVPRWEQVFNPELPQDASGELTLNEEMRAALSTPPEAAYAYAPQGLGQQTSSIVFWLRGGSVIAVYINDGMDGRNYAPN